MRKFVAKDCFPWLICVVTREVTDRKNCIFIFIFSRVVIYVYFERLESMKAQ